MRRRSSRAIRNSGCCGFLSLVADGHGQTVLLSGEPGIGKSRLLAAVGQSAVDAGARRIRIHCEAQHAASALHPIVEILNRLYGAASQSPEDGLARLRAEFGDDAEAEEHYPDLAALAGLRQASTLAGRTPDVVRERTLEAIVEWIACAASAQILFFAIEDVHWADPTTLEVIARVLDRIDGLRLYFALTYRPEFNAPWPRRSNVSQFMLGRLTDSDAEALIRARSGDRQLGADTIATIVERADGIPLYLEELVASVLAAGSAENLSIPETLHDSLMARLDRLSDVREIAQLAAVLGREFSYEVMREVSTADEQTLRPALARLVAQEILQRHGSGAKTSYQFRHALMRDIAYDSTLISRRQQFHKRVADVLQARLSTGLGGASEIVAHHYTEAREYARALGAWRVAAEASLASSALRETLSQTASGIAIAEKVPPSTARARDVLALYMARGSALIALSGQGSPEVEATYARALALCNELGDTRDLFFVRFGVWRFYLTRFDVTAVREIAEELFERSARLEDRDIAIAAHMALGFILYHAGELRRAMEIVDSGTRVFVESLASDPRTLGAFAGQNPAMGLLFCGAFMNRLVGRTDDALLFESRAFRIAESLDSPFQTACARVFRAMLNDLRGDADAALADAETAIALATEHAFPLWRILGRLQRGSALASLGRGDEGIAEMRAALDAMESNNLLMFRTRAAVLLVTASLRAHRVADARESIAKARSVWSTSGERWWSPEIDRL
ncbi:MAG: AAA family ATPase, partial [Candidatus Eremiobacteraeota bacterium]|nr:AAA family ATPase [Candidatus Eremiobacteraeota bacterium]